MASVDFQTVPLFSLPLLCFREIHDSKVVNQRKQDKVSLVLLKSFFFIREYTLEYNIINI